MPEDSVLNNVRLARCFFYVSGILDQVIANGGKVVSISQKDFFITDEELRRVNPSQEPIRITQFVDLIMNAINDPDRKRLKTTTITGWLIQKGFMTKQADADGKSQRLPTAMGPWGRKSACLPCSGKASTEPIGRSSIPRRPSGFFWIICRRCCRLKNSGTDVNMDRPGGRQPPAGHSCGTILPLRNSIWGLICACCCDKLDIKGAILCTMHTFGRTAVFKRYRNIWREPLNDAANLPGSLGKRTADDFSVMPTT